MNRESTILIIEKAEFLNEIEFIKNPSGVNTYFYNQNKGIDLSEFKDISQIVIVDTFGEKLFQILADLQISKEKIPVKVFTHFLSNYAELTKESIKGIDCKPCPYSGPHSSLLKRTLEILCSQIQQRVNELKDRFENIFETLEITIQSVESPCLVYQDLQGKAFQSSASSVFVKYLEQAGIRLKSEGKQSEIDKLFSSSLTKNNKLLPNKLLNLYPVIPAIKSDDSFSKFTNHLEKKDINGLTFYSNQSEGQPILIINALGIPAFFWDKTIDKLQKKHKIILYQSKCSNLILGGMKEVVSLKEHIESINEILSREGVKEINVIAWCNGGRIGLGMSQLDVKVNNLFLVAPVLKNTTTSEKDCSNFEIELDAVFNQVIAKEKKSLILSNFLVKSNEKVVVPSNLAPDQILAHKNSNRSRDVIAPMAKPHYLVNYAKRTKLDEALNVKELIDNYYGKITLILGANDDVISNEYTLSQFENANELNSYTIKGTGHYLMDQAHDAFLQVIHHHISNEQVPILSNRCIESSINKAESCY